MPRGKKWAIKYDNSMRPLIILNQKSMAETIASCIAIDKKLIFYLHDENGNVTRKLNCC